MFLPTSKEDETKNLGCVNVFLKILENTGLINVSCKRQDSRVKKEEKFQAIKSFCSEKKVDHDSFNHQALFATSGATNFGIDNTHICCVFR